MKKLALAAIMTVALFATGCTENTMARKWGGSMNIELDEGVRLVNCTWKAPESSLWILTKYEPSQPPTTYKFEEKSAFGVVEGKVVIKEK